MKKKEWDRLDRFLESLDLIVSFDRKMVDVLRTRFSVEAPEIWCPVGNTRVMMGNDGEYYWAIAFWNYKNKKHCGCAGLTLDSKRVSKLAESRPDIVVNLPRLICQYLHTGEPEWVKEVKGPKPTSN